MLTKEDIEKRYSGRKLGKLKHLDLWGKDLENIDIISQLKSLEIVCLSGNKITSLKPFECLENLKDLYIRNNNIDNLDEIDYLKNCKKLKKLWMEDNPVCQNSDEYKKIILEKLPDLEELDNRSRNLIKKDF